jgi:transcriptional regulator with XRE-family HTH domain
MKQEKTKRQLSDETKKIINTVIGNRIETIRRSKKMTIHALAIKTSMNNAQIISYEKAHRTIPVYRLIIIAKALEVSIEYLCGQVASSDVTDYNDFKKNMARYDLENIFKNQHASQEV